MGTCGKALALADEYARVRDSLIPPQCREPAASYGAGFHGTERHLQCVWFDSRLRPAEFRLPSGETVAVLDPGEWNLEAGPDFLNATLLIRPGERRVRGDVEVHVRPSDWDAHGHSSDPAYAHVIAHVTWFPGPAPQGLPASAVSLPLCAPLTARPGFSLDDIDLKAYPHAILPESPRPCEAFLRDEPDRAARLLASAGQYRLRAKAVRTGQRIEQTGDRCQVFYEEVMAALGYKHNQSAFRALAKRLPFAALAEEDRPGALAGLLGIAGLLPQPEAAPDDEGRRAIRGLWDRWWRVAGGIEPGEPIEWSLSGVRPQNAPVRRLAAAACLFTGKPTLLETIDALGFESGLRWRSQAADCFTARCRWPFWNKRLVFSSAPDEEQDITLLGDSRVSAILTNLVLPMALAEGRWPEDKAILRLPAEDLSAPMRLTAWHLLGRDHNPSLYSDNGLYQQGLLKIHLDFCLDAQPDCSGCPLRAALARPA